MGILCLSSAFAQAGAEQGDSYMQVLDADSVARVELATLQIPVATENQPPSKISSMFSGFWRDEAQIWTSPFRMDSEDLLWVGGIAATTALLIAIDEPVYKSFRDFKNDHTWVQKTSPVATQLGEFYVPYAISALYCLKGLAFDDEHALDTGLLSVQAMIHSAVVVQLLKHLFGRMRPYVRNGEDVWYGPRMFFKRYSGGFSSYDAFPSGHTITAFSLAAVVAERSEHAWVKATAYSLAGLCGLSRLTEHNHWLSDVVVGAAMGIAIGKLVARNHERSVTLTPSFGSRGAGVNVVFSY